MLIVAVHKIVTVVFIKFIYALDSLYQMYLHCIDADLNMGVRRGVDIIKLDLVPPPQVKCSFTDIIIVAASIDQC